MKNTHGPNGTDGGGDRPKHLREVIPLHDPELEKALLGACIIHPEIIDASRVTASDFYSGAHEVIWSALSWLRAEGKRVDTFAVMGRLSDMGRLAYVGGDSYLLALTDTIPDPHVDYTRLRRLARQRDVQVAARLLGGAAADDQPRALEFLERARRALELLTNEPREPHTVDPARPLLGLARLERIAVVGLDALTALAGVATDYAWQDIAVAGTIVLIAGEPSGGKTTLTFMILVARATVGGPVMLLERLVAPAPVGKWLVLIEAEHSESSTARKLLRMADLVGVDRASLGRIIVIARKQVVLGSPEWDDLRALIARGVVSDVVIDTVARVAPADANDERDQVQVFDVIAQAIEGAPRADAKPVVWVVAHTKKSTTGDLTDVSGSTQRVGQADTVLLVKGSKVDGRTVSSRVTFAKLREDPDEYPRPVDFAIERDAVGRPVLRVGGTVHDERPLTTRIVDLLRDVGPQKKRDLMLTLERSGADVEAAISALFAQRRLITKTVTVRGVERKAFDLAPDPEISRDDSRDEPF